MNRWWIDLLRAAPPRRATLAGLALLLLGQSLIEALRPWPVKLLVDHVIPAAPLPPAAAWLAALPGGNHAYGLCLWLAASTLVIFGLAWTVQTGQAYLQSGLSLRMTYDLGARVFEHLQHLSLRYHGRQPAGDVIRRVTRDSRCARDLLMNSLLPATSSCISIVVMWLVMWRMHAPLSLLALLVLIPIAWAHRRFYEPMLENAGAQHQCEADMQSLAEQSLTALPMIQLYGRQDQTQACYREATQRTLQAYFMALRSQTWFDVSVRGSTAVAQAAMMVAGGTLVLHGQLTVGELLVFLSYVTLLFQPIETLAQSTANVAQAEAAARRVLQVLQEADRVPDAATDAAHGQRAALPTCDWTASIHFQQVRFGYTLQQPVFSELKCQLPGGKVTALVGPSGAGKSTIASLLLRFYDPQSGRITLGDTDLKDIPLADLRQHIAVLLQEPFLLPTTIRENIAYGRPEATMSEIEAAARAARADDFIQKLPQGYETLLGEAGGVLSGGERQRLAIARAFLKDAPILILDEPTSALDAQTEDELVQTLQQLTRNRTTLVIAHRLSTIRNADQILFLSEGQVVEAGTESELLALNGRYRSWLQQSLSLPSQDPMSVMP